MGAGRHPDKSRGGQSMAGTDDESLGQAQRGHQRTEGRQRVLPEVETDRGQRLERRQRVVRDGHDRDV